MTGLTVERLKSLLNYDDESGKFFFRHSRGGYPAGHPAGNTDRDGYVLICLDRKLYRAHRLVWFLFNGEMPEHQIDHIDRDPANNRITNLRSATPGQNNQNRIKARSDNISGLLGVKYDRRRGTWSSRITVNRKAKWLGSFATKEEAHEAYLRAKREVHAWHFSSNI